MNKPSEATLDLILPAYDVEGLPLSDRLWVRNVAGAEPHNTMRLPRSNSTLVAVKRFWDGGTDGAGEPCHYVLLWSEFLSSGTRWRLMGVRIRAEEAGRVARDLTKHKASKPGRNEPVRPGGKTGETDGSELRGVPVGKDYLLFVQHRSGKAGWARSRGCMVLEAEVPIVLGLLKTLSKETA